MLGSETCAHIFQSFRQPLCTGGWHAFLPHSSLNLGRVQLLGTRAGLQDTVGGQCCQISANFSQYAMRMLITSCPVHACCPSTIQNKTLGLRVESCAVHIRCLYILSLGVPLLMLLVLAETLHCSGIQALGKSLNCLLLPCYV